MINFIHQFKTMEYLEYLAKHYWVCGCVSEDVSVTD